MHRKATGVVATAVGLRGLASPSRLTSDMPSSTRLSAKGKPQEPSNLLLAAGGSLRVADQCLLPLQHADSPDARAALGGG